MIFIQLYTPFAQILINDFLWILPSTSDDRSISAGKPEAIRMRDLQLQTPEGMDHKHQILSSFLEDENGVTKE